MNSPTQRPNSFPMRKPSGRPPRIGFGSCSIHDKAIHGPHVDIHPAANKCRRKARLYAVGVSGDQCDGGIIRRGISSRRQPAADRRVEVIQPRIVRQQRVGRDYRHLGAGRQPGLNRANSPGCQRTGCVRPYVRRRSAATAARGYRDGLHRLLIVDPHRVCACRIDKRIATT